MNPNLFERRFGYGAARVPLRPSVRRGRSLRTLREGIALARRDGDSLGRSVRSIGRAMPALMVVAVALTALFAGILTPPPDESEITIVAFQAPPETIPLPEPEPLQPEPEPPPVVAKPEPPPVPRPEPPPAEPVPRPEPPPAKPPPAPRPQIQQIARLDPAPPPPDAPRRVSREKPREQPVTPRLSFDPLAAPDPVAPPPPPNRTEHFAAARPPDTRPRLDAPALRAAPAPSPPQALARRPAAPRKAPERPATPRLALAVSTPALPGPPPAPTRNGRRAPATTPPRRSRRSPVAVAVPDAGADPGPRRASSAAVARPRLAPPAPAPAARARAEEPGVRGVPLGSLAACVSDRAEDALKQRVVAAVRDRTHCQSPAGRYHFVETKNVNAFLMRIEQAPGRPAGDRCEELTWALDCLGRR